MKPSPKPSLLMLWIARLYAMFGLSLSLFHLISYSRVQDTAVITYSPRASGMTGSSSIIVTHHAPAATLYIGTLLMASLALGLFMLNRKSGQMIVLAAALGSLGLNFYGVSHLLYLIMRSHHPFSAYMHHSWFWEVFVSSACIVVIQLGNMWLALRPPALDKNGESHLPPLSSAHPI